MHRLKEEHAPVKEDISSSKQIQQIVGYPKPCMKQPQIAVKPILYQKPCTIERHPLPTSSYGRNNGRFESPMSVDVNELSKRLLEVEKMLETERKINATLTDLLSQKDSRIRELLVEVEALNEDLNLADEDYERLEAENSAIIRAMSQLNSQVPSE
jgi:hypothetical protein